MSTLAMPEAPRVKLRSVSYDEMMGYNARTRSFQATGTANIADAIDGFATWASTTGADRTVAMDIETRGTDSDTWWEVTCLTAAFHTHIGVVSVLFDPLRNMEHRKLIRRLVDLSSRLVFHNAGFDIPPLVAHSILTLDDVNKVWDTLILAKMIRTSDRAGRSLEELAVRYGIVPDDGIKMARVFTASGYGAVKDGFANVDLDSGTYRDGAMSDTVVTLRLLPILEQDVVNRHDASRNSSGGATLTADGAKDLVRKMQRMGQICLRRAARGYRFDPTFPAVFQQRTNDAMVAAVKTLTDEGLEPGRGDHLVEKLYARGQLLEGWARTSTGKLSADKKAMARLVALNHPLAEAHLVYTETTKIAKYLSKIIDQGRATGRIHPTIGVLAASASGRMAVANPELHQFPGNARGIILADELPGWSSVDWSSIEPVVMAVCAGDNDFITPFYEGRDLYVPVARTAGLIPYELTDEDAVAHKGRKVAKVLLLAGMYGQGLMSMSDNLAVALKHAVPKDEAKALSASFRAAMPVTFAFMKQLESIADGRGSVTTIAGRVLDEDRGFTYRAVNHFCQGSAADVLYDATLRLDDAGLSDHIHLWMHDELVVSSEVQEEVSEVMMTPPSSLMNWARTDQVKLRIDANPMGLDWKSV